MQAVSLIQKKIIEEQTDGTNNNRPLPVHNVVSEMIHKSKQQQQQRLIEQRRQQEVQARAKFIFD